jgi:hypothetical protein
VQIPEQVRIAIFSQFNWKKILTHGILFPWFAVMRQRLDVEYRKLRPNCQLIWCDPSSLVQVRMMFEGGRELLFLFNGTQFATIRLVMKEPRALEYLRARIHVDDLQEQLSTMVGTKLIVERPGKVYEFNRDLDIGVNRNFAKKYTSAANLQLLRMKEEAKKVAIRSRIVLIVKRARESGLQIRAVINDVKTQLDRFFPVDIEMVRGQMKELEVMKYMKVEEKGRDKGGVLVYLPD